MGTLYLKIELHLEINYFMSAVKYKYITSACNDINVRQVIMNYSCQQLGVFQYQVRYSKVEMSSITYAYMLLYFCHFILRLFSIIL